MTTEAEKLIPLSEELEATKASVEKKAREVLVLQSKNKELENKLLQSKEFMQELYKEIEFLQNKAKLQKKENSSDAQFKSALESMAAFDVKLKDVYSCCIDLYVSLDKNQLVKTEKKLNDCIFEFKDIKDRLLKNI